MCVVSMVSDHYRDKWTPLGGGGGIGGGGAGYFPILDPISRAEFDKLKADVEEMKALLQRAKMYDAKNGEPDCEMADKVDLLRKVADLVGVSLDDVFPETRNP
jgi:hypothetical protein